MSNAGFAKDGYEATEHLRAECRRIAVCELLAYQTYLSQHFGSPDAKKWAELNEDGKLAYLVEDRTNRLI